MLTAALLSACGQAPVPEEQTITRSADRIACAQNGAKLAPACTVEREQTGRGLLLTLRHPDGAFRRLLVTQDGRGVGAADGAEPARVTLTGANEIEVALGGDRYRLPATAKGQAAAP